MRKELRGQPFRILKSMSPEKQRIAIAEACGWKDCHATGGLPCGVAPGELEHRQIPNHLNDIVAAQFLLDDLASKGWECESLVRFYNGYRKVTARIWNLEKQVFHQATGTNEASTICECYLRSLGKWEEEPT